MNKRILTAVFAGAFALTAGACQVNKTEDGEMPDVDVDAGKLPEYDVQTPEVEVNKDTNVVVTPDIDVTTPPDTTQQ